MNIEITTAKTKDATELDILVNFSSEKHWLKNSASLVIFIPCFPFWFNLVAQMTLPQYIETISERFKKGDATEHTYRGDLQTLIESMMPGVMATNEPKRIDCGAPDYIITRKNIPLGYIEAKDIDDGLEEKGHKEQFDRYRKVLENLIITDYLDFHFYKLGEKVTSIRIGKTDGKKIIPFSDKFDEFTALIKNFCEYKGQTIKSSKTLAEMMAGKARMLANVIENALNSDAENSVDSSLKEQMTAFKDILIHDITAKEFSDIYAQTVAYGMFAARLHDPTLDNFTRQEAAELIPKSNPFLRKLFGYIAGPDIDERIVWIVDALADIFRATDVATLLKDFGKSTQQQDPIIHFYETFLAEYDLKLRKARGVWYTPAPVVNFIVRAVDDILKTEFNLPDGLADKSKIKIKANLQETDKRYKENIKTVEQEVHKVQILDPATGTGTFLAEVIKQVHKKFEGQQGVWSNYVEEHLVPRLNGFELLMASYAMAHLKLDLLLTETGYKPKKQNRLRVYLTNSLEEHHPDTGTLFASWLSAEANEANHIKRDTPVMVVMGNPPYSISSSNKGEWIQNLIADYKKDLNERKINLDDDYIKFIRYGQYFIEKNGEGVLAYITNNSFIDGITHRQMRKHLLETFDKIYILDLHGFAKLKEINLVAENDENVFDIQQGVSINIFIKTTNKSQLGEINYLEQYGTREEKYKFLKEGKIKTLNWKTIKPYQPHYFFVQKDFAGEKGYNKWIKITDIFVDSNSGIKTDRDSLFYDTQKDILKNRIQTLLSPNLNQKFINDYNVKDSGSYKITQEIKKIKFNHDFIQKNMYRPFDNQWTYYDPKLISRPAQKAMAHFNNHKNIGLILGRQGQAIGHMQWNLIFCTDSLTDYNVFYRGGGYVFPLYHYPQNKTQKTLYDKHERTPNLNKEIVEKIAEGLGLEFTNEKESRKNTFSPIDILDYIYAALHSPTYREKYKEFLKIDFPRVPYPKDAKIFWQLVKLGGELRQIHLLESAVVNKPITKFPVDGDNIVVKIKFVLNDAPVAEKKATKKYKTINYEPTGTASTPLPYIGPDDISVHNEFHEPEIKYSSALGKVFINDSQYFDKVPQIAWEFYIGGYQPAQKWLKDRKERTLTYDDIEHYQKIIVALSETDRLMKEIDEIKFV